MTTPPLCTNECKGVGLNDQDWMSKWDNGYCYNCYDNWIYTGLDNKRTWNSANWRSAQNDFTTIFNRYLSNNKITVPGATGYNNFQEVLNKSCNQLPGVCATALNSYCRNNVDASNPNLTGPNGCGANCNTREGIAANQGILNFCGCYAPVPSEPAASDAILKAPSCDPLCSRINSIQSQINNVTGNPVPCNSNTCVIDNVTIEASSSNVGSINFNQICNNCVGKDTCVCIISGVNITDVTNKVSGLSTQFNQYCNGAGNVCYSVDSASGVSTEVPCATILDTNKNFNNTEPDSLSTFSIIMVIIAVLIVLIIFILIIYSANNKKQK